MILTFDKTELAKLDALERRLTVRTEIAELKSSLDVVAKMQLKMVTILTELESRPNVRDDLSGLKKDLSEVTGLQLKMLALLAGLEPGPVVNPDISGLKKDLEAIAKTQIELVSSHKVVLEHQVYLATLLMEMGDRLKLGDITEGTT